MGEITNITECICCNKECKNPETRFSCKCKFCDPLKCPCDYNIFLDINILAQRVRDKYDEYDLAYIPKYDVNKKFDGKYEFKMYHPRKMSECELDDRWISPPKCQRECIYPCQDRKDHKFYPAICYNNRIIAKFELLLTYQYKMDFIAFGEYFQIMDEAQIVSPGGVGAYSWNNPPIEKQHGFYNKVKIKTNHKKKNLLGKQLKGTPSFDFLNIELNEKSPLIGTEWEHKKIIYSYPPGARKYNLEIRKKKVINRRKKEKELKLQQMSSIHCTNYDQYNYSENTIYQTEEYKDTESSSSSNSEEREYSLFLDGNDDDNVSEDNMSDDAWTPNTNNWQQTLPEYQYQGLRRNNTKKKGTKNNTKKRGRGRPRKYPKKQDSKKTNKKKKKKKLKKKESSDDSEDEYIISRDNDSEMTQDEDDDDIQSNKASKKKKKKKQRHSHSSKKKKKHHHKKKKHRKKEKKIKEINLSSLPLQNIPDVKTLKLQNVGLPEPAGAPLINYNNNINPRNQTTNIQTTNIYHHQNINNFGHHLNNDPINTLTINLLNQRQRQLSANAASNNNNVLFSKQKERQRANRQTQQH